MEPDKPILHVFEECGKYYCYDPYPNKIFSISRDHYNEIKKLLSLGKRNYIASLSDIAWESTARDILFFLNSEKYFSGKLFETSEYPDSELIPGLYDKSINDLALQITKNCNFSCRYCQYANDNGITRTHENAIMNEKTAKASVDYLMSHSSDANKVNIAFCGGEPLLNFGLIEIVLRYVDAKYPYKMVTYNLTSNASLLNKEHINLFKKYNLKLMISMDGPESVQNYNRKFRADGEGTYSIVFDKVKQLMKTQKKYFDKNVSFNAVYLNSAQKRDAELFFNELGIIDKVRLVEADLKGIDYIAPNNKFISKTEITDNNEISPDSWYMVREPQMRNDGAIPSIWHHGGPCIPGIRRLFVDTEGIFYPCEKLTEISGLSIGSLTRGIDTDLVLRLMNIGNLTHDKCRSCFAFRFCSICCSHCFDPEKNCLSSEAKAAECDNQKKIADAFLHKFVHKIGISA